MTQYHDASDAEFRAELAGAFDRLEDDFASAISDAYNQVAGNTGLDQNETPRQALGEDWGKTFEERVHEAFEKALARVMDQDQEATSSPPTGA